MYLACRAADTPPINTGLPKYILRIFVWDCMPRISRRSILASCGFSLLPTISGCSGRGFFSQPFDPHDHVSDWQDEPARGKANPIETEQTVDSQNSLESKCLWVSTEAVESTVANRVSLTRTLHFDYRKADGVNDGEWFVEANRIIYFTQSNEVHLKPEIPFATLCEATPRTVRTTLTGKDEEYSCRHPVYVSDYAEQVAP